MFAATARRAATLFPFIGLAGLKAIAAAETNVSEADLLFTSNRGGNSEIWLREAGVAEWTNLTRNPAKDNWPVWSPAGNRIVFQSDRDGKLDIWVMDADGAHQTRLTTDPEPDYLPAWSPDGNTIVFTSWRKEEGDPQRAAHLYRMDADGKNQRRLVAEALGTSEGAAFAPDGKTIVYARKHAPGADLYLADADGGNQRRLTQDGEKDIYNGSPQFSPDGRWIAFYSDAGGVAALQIIGADGKGRRTVHAIGSHWYPRWSADGQWLVYCAPAPGAADDEDIDIYAVRLDGARHPVQLIGGPGREVEASWRP